MQTSQELAGHRFGEPNCSLATTESLGNLNGCLEREQGCVGTHMQMRKEKFDRIHMIYKMANYVDLLTILSILLIMSNT